MKKLLFIILASLAVTACKVDPKEELAGYYDCELSFPANAQSHPKSLELQAALEKQIERGFPGATMLVKSPEGLFMGAAGKADIGLDVDMEICHKHLVASISKVYTATVTYALVDQGLLDLDKTAADYLDQKWMSRLANADIATLKHLLGHRSGIPDYLETAKFDLDMINDPYSDWDQEDQIAYAFDVDAYFAPDAEYYYSNTNFVLLGMVAEKVSGKPLGQLYREYIFSKLDLKNSYYDAENPIPPGTVKGYIDLFTNGNVIDNESIYQNELHNGDGGIATNTQDMMLFFEGLRSGKLLSEASYAQMTDWFPLDDWGDQIKNGYGLEYYDTPLGEAYGHTGGIYGFISIMLYIPERDMTFIIYLNAMAGTLAGAASDIIDEMYEVVK
ncbi:MAG: serine hydrolase domain-containing protein [Bacteroidia bacterium]